MLYLGPNGGYWMGERKNLRDEYQKKICVGDLITERFIKPRQPTQALVVSFGCAAVVHGPPSARG